MKNYKLVGEDEHTFRVQHPNGEHFTIAKSMVGEGVHKQIKALKMSDGGEVPDNDAAPAQDQSDWGKGLRNFLGVDDTSAPQDAGPAATPAPVAADPAQWSPPAEATQVAPAPEAARAPQSVPGDGAAPMPAAPMAAPQPQAAPAMAPTAAVTPASLQSDVAGAQGMKLGNEAAAVNKANAIEQGAYQQQSKDYAKLAQDEEKVNAELQAKTAPIEAQNQILSKAIMEGKIDHNRLYSNMSTGNKVLAALAVAFSGIGAGMTGQKNMAMEVIQKNIDRDIEDQKAELGKKQTLFSENLRMLGDARAAAVATKAQMASAVQAKAASYMASAHGAQANLQNQVLLSNIGIEQQKLTQQAGLLALAAKGGNMDPAMLVPRLVPEGRQKEVFEEIKNAQNIRRGKNEGMAAFDKAAEEQVLFSKNAIPKVNSPYVGQLKASVLPQFQNIDGTVRQAAMDAFLPTVTPAIGDTKHTQDVKRNTLESWYVAHSSAPTAKGYGIDLDKFGTTNSEKAPPTKTHNGIKYMRGPNGEAVKVK